MNNLVPIVLFAYNRPNHTRHALASLAACARLDECQIYIHSDGPRLHEHEPAVKEVRSIIRDWGMRHKTQIIEQNENLGLACSIVSGVSHLCEEYGRVLVVEDDLILHPAFIHYMLSALDRYQEEERVAQISGYMFPIKCSSRTDCFFLPLTTTWGWATWKHSWDLFNWNAPLAIQTLVDPKMRSNFDLNDAYPYTGMLADRLAGRNQSWGILFYWACFSASKLVLHPVQSLVNNAGFDGSGYHHRRPSTGFLSAYFTDWASTYDPVFPEKVEIDQHAFECICSYLNQSTHVSFADQMRQKIRGAFPQWVER